jgi:transcriptional regulator with XRE-family HTH domain
MKKLDHNPVLDFQDKEYAHTFINEILCAKIATQIKVLREQNNWKQEDLAKEAHLTQETISRMENVNYSSWRISSLKKLAKAFDLALHVSFENFSTELNSITNIDRESLERTSRNDEIQNAKDELLKNIENVIVGTGTFISSIENTFTNSNNYQAKEVKLAAKVNTNINQEAA